MSSCFLLPKEAETPDFPLVTPYDGSDFRTSLVIRGDMEYSRTINCTYQATQERRYSFEVTGEYFGEIYVNVGDVITAGTLLAEMDVSEVNKLIEDCRFSIDTLEIQLDEAKKAYELALKQEALLGNVSTVSSDARLASVDYIKASLDIRRSRLAELEEIKKQRQLFSDIDGMVSYVKTVSESMTTIKGEKIVTVTDDSSAVFVANTEYYEKFPAGQKVDIVSDGVTYECVAVSPEELGLEPVFRQDGSDTQKVYFMILGAETPTTVAAKGEITILNESRKDVLLVKTSAVFKLNDKEMVYVQGTDGSISVVEVVTGLKSTKYTEIISGLNEGDCVIIK